MKKLFVILCATVTLSANAQNDLLLNWAKVLNNDQPRGVDVTSRSIKVDGNGNIYIAGSFRGTVDFDPGAGVANLASATSTSNDIFVAKYDASGNYVFAYRIGGGGDDICYALTLDGSDNIYITGGASYDGPIDFDPNPATTAYVALSTGGSSSVFIAKYNSSGNYVYAKATEGTGGGSGRAIAVDGSGNIYITGIFTQTVDFNPDPAGTANLISAGNSDIFIAKYNTSGNYVYAKRMGGTAADQGNSIAVDGSGNVVVTGFFNGIADFDPDLATTYNFTSAGFSDAFLAKYNTSGNFVYAWQFGSTGSDNGRALVIDGSANVYLTCEFSNTVDFNPDLVATANLTSNGANRDICLAKYDASGNYVYAKSFGGAGVEIPISMARDANGYLYITGQFSGTAQDFDPDTLATANLSSAGNNDIFMAKYDSSGNYVYAKNMGGTQSDAGFSIAIDVVGNTYITGIFNSIADFDPGVDTANQATGTGSISGYAGKYNSTGDYVWALAIGGYNSTQFNEEGNDIAFDASGNAYVTGYFLGTVDFNPNPAITTYLTSAGGADIFLAKYDPAGNLIYAHSIGGTSLDQGYSLAVDGSGNVCLAGKFSSSTIDFDPDPVNNAILTRIGTSDIFIAKYDASGNYLFAKNMSGTSSSATINSSTIDGSGNIYITGFYTGTVDFDPGVNTVNLIAGADNTAYLAKYDASGNYLYARSANNSIFGTEESVATSVAADGSGNAYITGYFQGETQFSAVTLASDGDRDVFYAKYDASGTLVYAQRVGGLSADEGNSIAVDGSGNVYITGYFAGSANFNPAHTGIGLSPSGMFIAKYNSSGNYLFAKGIEGANGKTIALDGSGNICLIGFYSGIVDFDPGIGTANLPDVAPIFIAKYDSSGNYIYAKSIGGAGDSYGNSIAVDNNGNVWCTGYLSGNGDFDPGTGNLELAALNEKDIFIARYTESSPNTIVTGSISSPICAGEAVNVPYTANGTFNGGNIFTAQLSNAGGSFTSATIIGALAATTSGTISATIPIGTAVDSNYRIRVVSSSPAVIGANNGSDIIINAGCPAVPNAVLVSCADSCNYSCNSGFANCDGNWVNGCEVNINNDAANCGACGVSVSSVSNGTGFCNNGVPDFSCDSGYVKGVSTCFIPAITPNDTTICQGQSVTLTASPGAFYNWSIGSTTQSITVSFSGIYSVTITGPNSTVSATVTVASNSLLNPNISICDGDSLFASGSFQKSSGVYIDSLLTYIGCDSIIITNLTVISNSSSSRNVSLCDGDSLFAGGSYQTTSGVYYDTLNSYTGCDSIVTTTINIPNCDDNNPCTDDACNNGVCEHTNNAVSCDDDNPCTLSDACFNGVCAGTPINCDDSLSSTLDYCVNGSCIHSNFNTWAAAADFASINRAGAIAFSANGYGYIGTGYDIDNTNYLNDLWRYDPVSNSWTEMDTLPGAGREQAVCFVIDTNVYVGTGKNASGDLKDFYKYLPLSNIWLALGDFDGTARHSAVAFSIGTDGFLATGMDNSGRKKDVWKYNTGSDTWTLKNDFFSTARFDAIAFSIGGKAYLGTGDGAAGRLNDFWEYNPVTDFWIALNSFPSTNRAQAVGVAAIGNRGYIATGKDNSNALVEIWEYSPPPVDSWVQKADLPGQSRYEATGFIIGDKAYVGTGYLENIVARLTGDNDFWEYSPGCPDCDDGNPCTLNLCDGVDCVYPPVVCNDDNPCTTDQCVEGGCKYTNQCDDSNPCTVDVCGVSGCEHTAYVCNDNNICTSDNCGANGCVFTPIVCTSNISGMLLTENGNPISGAFISLTGTENQTDTSDVDGHYSFDVTQGASVNIAPAYKDALTSTCITTIDLVRMQRHILVIDTLGSLYKIIAGDVNINGNLSTIDIGKTRAVILGNDSTFNGRLWTFVQTDFEFSDSLHPFSFDTNRSYQDISADTLNQNFIGIRLGDVNGTCDPANPRLSIVGEVNFSMEEFNKLPGEEITIPVKVGDFKNIAGYQFTLSWNPEVLSFLEVNNFSLAGFYGTQNAAAGFLTTSWNDATGGAASLNDEAVMFELKFKVTGMVGSYSEIKIGSEITASESYNDNLELLSINPTNGLVNVGDLTTQNSQPATRNTTHLSVQPNPFNNATNIIFNLQKEEQVTIEVYDFLGKTVKQFRANYKAGKHKIEWTGDDSKGTPLSSGLYHIRMKAGNETQGVKVVLVR